ncbi:MFS hexose transporter [Cladophialophora carrionii]|uniref:MFS hexose transporter n=1 Tax=Cladophialophora carrionii TaxID=86049 RepID=A0A1C1CAM9_9EURO|nr:MFS hexose transporter [Cladophialophora carrionii]
MSQGSDSAIDALHDDVSVTEVKSSEVSFAQYTKPPSFFGSLRKHRTALLWCLYILWCVLANNYAKTAGQSVLGIPQFRKDFGNAYNGNFVLSAKWQSAYYGAPQAASVIGALGGAWVADRLGRRASLAFLFGVRLISVTLEYIATTNEVFFAGRFLGGFSTGGTNSICMAYIGEITPLPLRGVLTAAMPIALITGSLASALVVNFTGDQATHWAYRIAFVSGYGFMGIAVLVLPFMPESPWWLASHGKPDKAMKALRKIGFTDATEADIKMAEIKRVLAKTEEETSGATYAECFRRSNLRRTIIAAMPLTIQTFSGVTFVGSYSTYYQQLAGYSAAASFKLFIVQQVLSGAGNVVSWYLVDRVGRRRLTLSGMIILTTLLLITGGLAVSGTPGAIRGTIALLQLFCFVYNATIGATAYTIMTEIPTARLRAKTASLSVGLQSALFARVTMARPCGAGAYEQTMWGFVLPYLFNPDKANLGAKVTFIFGALSVLSICYLWAYQPESAGLSYERLDELFIGRVKARMFKEKDVRCFDRAGAEDGIRRTCDAALMKC